MNPDTKEKVREIISSIKCIYPEFSCPFCTYFEACKAITLWYNSLDSDNTKENEE